MPLTRQITEFLNKQLNISLEPQEINDVFRIGKNTRNGSRSRPVLLKLVSYLKKVEILGRLKELKGSGVSVAEDLTVRDREISKVLYDHYKAAKTKGYPARLLRNAVMINGVKYSYEELEDINILDTDNVEIEQKSRRSTSLPASPNIEKSEEQSFQNQGSVSQKAYRPAAVQNIGKIASQQKTPTSQETHKSTSTVARQGAVPKQTGLEKRTRSGSKSSVSSI